MEEEIRALLALPEEQSSGYVNGIRFEDLVTFLGSKMGKVYLDLNSKYIQNKERIEDLEEFRTTFMVTYNTFVAEYELHKEDMQLQIDEFKTHLGTIEDFRSSIQETVTI